MGTGKQSPFEIHIRTGRSQKNEDLPFDVDDIESVEQSESDTNCERGRTLFQNAKEIIESRA